MPPTEGIILRYSDLAVIHVRDAKCPSHGLFCGGSGQRLRDSHFYCIEFARLRRIPSRRIHSKKGANIRVRGLTIVYEDRGLFRIWRYETIDSISPKPVIGRRQVPHTCIDKFSRIDVDKSTENMEQSTLHKWEWGKSLCRTGEDVLKAAMI